MIAARIRERTRDEWEDAFRGSDACVAPVLSMTEAPSDPQLLARQTFAEHHGVLQPAPAPRFSRTAASLDKPPPRPGEHTREALADWGIEHAGELLAAGIVQEAGPVDG